MRHRPEMEMTFRISMLTLFEDRRNIRQRDEGKGTMKRDSMVAMLGGSNRIL